VAVSYPRSPGTQYLFKGGFQGKASFSIVRYRPSEELPDEEYPFLLSTGRLLFQYHTGSMTRKMDAFNAVSPEAYVEINPDDAKQLGVDDGNRVKVSSRRGLLTSKLLFQTDLLRDALHAFSLQEAAANVLTSTALDPIAKIPELKYVQ